MNMENILEVLSLVGEATWQTLIMVFFSLLFSTLIGFPLGVLLSVTRPGNIMSKPVLNAVIGKIVNVLRAFPFLILIILLLPLRGMAVYGVLKSMNYYTIEEPCVIL